MFGKYLPIENERIDNWKELVLHETIQNKFLKRVTIITTVERKWNNQMNIECYNQPHGVFLLQRQLTRRNVFD